MGVETTVQLPLLDLRAEIRADTVDASKRTVDLVFSTGSPVLRYDWNAGERYYETLSLEPTAIRLNRLNTTGQLFDSHNTEEIRRVLGVVER